LHAGAEQLLFQRPEFILADHLVLEVEQDLQVGLVDDAEDHRSASLLFRGREEFRMVIQRTLGETIEQGVRFKHFSLLRYPVETIRFAHNSSETHAGLEQRACVELHILVTFETLVETTDPLQESSSP